MTTEFNAVSAGGATAAAVGIFSLIIVSLVLGLTCAGLVRQSVRLRREVRALTRTSEWQNRRIKRLDCLRNQAVANITRLSLRNHDLLLQRRHLGTALEDTAKELDLAEGVILGLSHVSDEQRQTIRDLRSEREGLREQVKRGQGNLQLVERLLSGSRAEARRLRRERDEFELQLFAHEMKERLASVITTPASLSIERIEWKDSNNIFVEGAGLNGERRADVSVEFKNGVFEYNIEGTREAILELLPMENEMVVKGARSEAFVRNTMAFEPEQNPLAAPAGLYIKRVDNDLLISWQTEIGTTYEISDNGRRILMRGLSMANFRHADALETHPDRLTGSCYTYYVRAVRGEEESPWATITITVPRAQRERDHITGGIIYKRSIGHRDFIPHRNSGWGWAAQPETSCESFVPPSVFTGALEKGLPLRYTRKQSGDYFEHQFTLGAPGDSLMDK